MTEPKNPPLEESVLHSDARRRSHESDSKARTAAEALEVERRRASLATTLTAPLERPRPNRSHWWRLW
ncbi:hypothetical protein [Variovorax saccharolyticus]|uniref:hypothetical protein n=1 Tax=Variovorax saccharolyticus TaxID=3053516 RepID=UPI0025759C11|nr:MULTISPECIES: hypothetical protein [unclassified Variovorax]MDM0022502.1 hypothetical protein [Variovorax sp. J22R187]MDM0028266.1 hypothetical protein [Variovorax sp. J31P216]